MIVRSFQMIEALKGLANEQGVTDADLISCLWQGLMSSIDWTSKADQIDAVVLKTIDVRVNSS